MRNYYISNQIYQFLYSEPIYRAMGGTFLAWKPRTYLRLKEYFLHGRLSKSKTSMPQIKLVNRLKVDKFNGILIGNSLHRLGYDRDKMKSALMYHGTSDKIPRAPRESVNQFDYYLLAGPKNEQKLAQAAGIPLDSPRLVRVGNWMFDPIINGTYDLDAIKQKYGFTDHQLPIILYAPTWRYGGGTLLQNYEYFINHIPEKYNLLIRPHYAERKLIPKMKLAIPRKYHGRVAFANSANIWKHHYMEDLAIADLLLSDTSSMLYEYLVTKKPIIVCDTDSKDVSFADDGMSVVHRVDHYRQGDDIMNLIQSNFGNREMKLVLNDLLQKCFFHNDGKSTQRCVDFFRSVGD